MTIWTAAELAAIGTANELDITTLPEDGTPRKPVTIWVVRHGDDLFVRSYKGRDAAWFRAVQMRHEGHIHSGGVAKDVAFVAETSSSINGALDAAYRAKYRRYPSYVSPMIASAARATTLKLVPHPR